MEERLKPNKKQENKTKKGKAERKKRQSSIKGRNKMIWK
jgi:hypothetical protein